MHYIIGIYSLYFPQIRASLSHGNANDNPQRQSAQEAVRSTLCNEEECCLCGSNSRSPMGLYRGKDELGIISLNNWYVLDMGIGKEAEKTMDCQNSSRITTTGEDGCSFCVDQNYARRISEVKIEYGEKSYFDINRVRGYLCQACLDNLLDVMEVCGDKKERPIGLCMIDFQTQKLYSLQDQHLAYYIRDYYVKI